MTKTYKIFTNEYYVYIENVNYILKEYNNLNILLNWKDYNTVFI